MGMAVYAEGEPLPPKPFPKLMRHKSTGNLWLMLREQQGVLLACPKVQTTPTYTTSAGYATEYEDYNEPLVFQNT